MSARASAHERPERTATSQFGAGRRESHDASDFYARFEAPEISSSDDVFALGHLAQGPDACIEADARDLVLPTGGPLPDNCVALVVTSPPYFSGKEYERTLGERGVPGSYLEYLQMLREVFAECKRVLEPGGRVAVNVANLGRKPYRSLASDVVRILQDDLRLLLRGEVVWRKGEGASGSCAWGSYRSARNPVLRDTSERVIVASKGRFDRAPSTRERQRLGLPHRNDIASDEFMEATLDVWNIPPESARRVQHPAPFPVELPQRLIGLYTYVNDLVLDPFMGSGSTLVAAIRANRRYLGYDTDPGYIAIARHRVTNELRARTTLSPVPSSARRGRQSAAPGRDPDDRSDDSSQEAFLHMAAARGKVIDAIAEDVISAAGFSIVARGKSVRGVGIPVDVVARDATGHEWLFDVVGAFTTTRNGLARTDAAWCAIGKASAIVRAGKGPLVLLTSHLPRPGTDADAALRAVGPTTIFDALELLDERQQARLIAYARGGHENAPAIGFWTSSEIASR
ncbi:MAG: site-specific DNA-methyltransferase [Acidimicrobiales bacterium]